MLLRVADVPPGRRRVRRNRLLTIGLTLLLVVVGSGAAIYLHLQGNLRTSALTGGGHEHANAAGDAPINLLVLGSDTRASKGDCSIGGDCSAASATSGNATSAGANADVEMLVHISADRSNATVMSIPRDTMVTVPQCTNSSTGRSEAPHLDRINSTLQYGPGCTASAVHQLTGVPIDHFMVIDFSGVVTMSDAVGGVQVCVDNNVYDPYSHLKLAKGRHTLKGLAALEFLRTRHGFGDGGDIGRTVAQHIFLSSMLRDMESASTLANPVKVLGLANAATSAVTVDDKLGSIPALTDLAYQLNQVPGSRTTFVTMPTVADPSSAAAVIPAQNASALFGKIAGDVSLTPGQGRKGSAAKSSASVPAASSSASPSVSSSGPTASAAADEHATTVEAATGCARVGTAATVSVGGVAMNPTQAFAASRSVPVSAP
ncbi:LCP family protein [Flexivirga sp. ID2601S]|uniref:LCP family protein n=1 Tax=Flexivirga aerilata TaxID=1656889 RepID=A0A849AML5_9MICO|nr:LCP family protein [Flexivirga aerilata]NNG40548.1 LCP family protein [Flexivirga aerilata]